MANINTYEELRKFPPMYFNSVSEIEKLYEYSCTMPTGVTVGKRWRRHDGSFDRDFMTKGGKPRWLIGRYEEAPDGPIRAPDPEGKVAWVWKTVAMCKTVWYRPVVRVKTRQEVVCS